jgi:hypothetical protein
MEVQISLGIVYVLAIHVIKTKVILLGKIGIFLRSFSVFRDMRKSKTG